MCLIFFGMIGWLLNMAQSSTSLGSLLLAVATTLFLGLDFVERRHAGVYLVLLVVIGALAEFYFGISDFVIEALGRNSTLTDRTYIWQILLNYDLNPILGVGFESFWLGDRPAMISRQFSFLINEAHNGYLETYINLGLLGVFLTSTMLLAAFLKSQRAFVTDFDFGRFRLAYLAAFIVYNWTEAAFRTHCLPFFLFFLIAIDYPRPILEPSAAVSDSLEIDGELASLADQNPFAGIKSAY
jgi:O-antigen ligase